MAASRLLPSLVAVGLLAAGGCGPDGSAPPAAREQAGAPPATSRGRFSDRFPNVELTSQHGERVRFLDLVRDRVVLLNLMYTTCTEICPGVGANLAEVHELLGPAVGPEVSMLSISIDPETDTPEVLRRYWEAFGARPGWLYLTGEREPIEALRRSLGIQDPDPAVDADRTQHSGILTFGNDRTGRWSALPALSEPRDIVETVVRLTRDERWRGPGRSPGAVAAPTLYAGRGVVRQLDPGAGTVVVEHEAIPGLMDAMTMAFVAEPRLLAALAPGQAVEFRVRREAGRFRIVELAAAQAP